jgi:two-component system sensor histidine kinase RegB
MSGRAGGSAAEEPVLVAIADIIDDLRSRLTPARLRRVIVRTEGPIGDVVVPRAGLCQTLVSLVTNALEASASDAPPVVVEFAASNEALRVWVVDHGSGLSPEELRRAGEPFYTTKEPGRGLGLGLFLARIFVERLGGTLTLQSGDGTTALVEIPTITTSVYAR